MTNTNIERAVNFIDGICWTVDFKTADKEAVAELDAIMASFVEPPMSTVFEVFKGALPAETIGPEPIVSAVRRLYEACCKIHNIKLYSIWDFGKFIELASVEGVELRLR